MTPEAIRQWQAIFRDIVITLVAAFLLVYEAVVVVTPNPYIIGAGVTLLGAPAALRLDKGRRGKTGDAGDREDDPYDGPGGYFRS
jgi:hypothetical protein